MRLPKLTLTQWIIIAAVVLFIAYDVLIYAFWGNDYTESRTVLKWSNAIRAIIFLAGVLCGHLFFPQHVYVKEKNNGKGG